MYLQYYSVQLITLQHQIFAAVLLLVVDLIYAQLTSFIKKEEIIDKSHIFKRFLWHVYVYFLKNLIV
jgi:hypothetical protein